MTVRAPRRGPESAGDRLARLLVLLPWLAERGEAPVAEAAARFGVSEHQLVADLELAAMCGLPPYVDELIDVFIDDGVITVGVPRLFTRPLRLNAREGFSLLAAGRAAMALPGADPAGPLGRALDKLEAALGGRPVLAVDVPQPASLPAVRAAAEHGEQLSIAYWSAHRAERTERVVEPLAVVADRGHWYLRARDVGAGDERWFRVDRIEEARPTGARFPPSTSPPPTPDWEEEFADQTLVTLRVHPDARWVAERYPVVEVEQDGDRLRLSLPITSRRWLERLVLRLGPMAEVVDPPELADAGRDAAQRLLARYR
ncbi:MAG TPA: WYL domain-containing protein [Acidimicrobiales bacterium]|jgi:proteasome accessory factor C|nr:WYL domain-containing protein [Acidimicrobiales bacterium]